MLMSAVATFLHFPCQLDSDLRKLAVNMGLHILLSPMPFSRSSPRRQLASLVSLNMEDLVAEY
jgi:hypothetical protein